MIDNVQYDVNEVNFISTQMQGRYEESLQDDAQRLRATQIQRFKLIDASLTESEVKINKKIVPTRKLVKLVKRKKIASMTSLMKEKYSDTAEKDTMSQLSILLFLSGKKHKVADILKKIELAEINSSEQREDFEDVEEGKMGEDCDENGTRFVYSKTEWNKILRNIKLQFPRLSIETKKSLQHMTKRIQIQQEMMESEGIGSIWTQSSATPSQSEYSIEDMKWLYNLTDEQVDYVKASNNGTISSEGGYFSDINEDQQLFVMTLSQVMNGKTKQIDTSSDEEEERDIGDKEIIPETIREEDGEILIGLPQEEVGIKTEELPRTPKLSREIDNADDDDEVIPNSSPDLSPIYVVTSSPQISPPKLEILETMYEKVDPISSHQREDIFSLDTLSFPIKEKESIITINSDIDDAEEVFSSSLPAQQKGESEVIYAEEIISSPVQSAETKEVEFKTPTKPRTKEVSKYPLDLLLDSPIKATMQTNSNKRALYNTSIVEIRGGMEINEQFDNVNENNIKVRKIGSRILPPIDSEDEIGDSQDDEPNTSISIIEISRIIDDKGSARRKSPHKDISPILQVPSSPNKKADEASKQEDEEEEDIFSTARNVFEDPIDENNFEMMTATQLKETFKEWGLKPVKGKPKMVQILQNLSQHIVQPSKSQSIGISQQEQVQSSINRRINEVVFGNSFWHVKFISFEPIILTEFKQWLEDEEGVRVEMDVLERYADEMGITTTKG